MTKIDTHDVVRIRCDYPGILRLGDDARIYHCPESGHYFVPPRGEVEESLYRYIGTVGEVKERLLSAGVRP